LYTKIHEIFFFSFPVELYEWITKLENDQTRWRLNNFIVWTPELVQRLETFEDKIARTIDHWLNRIIGGFVIEFVFNTFVSYSEAKRCFFKAP